MKGDAADVVQVADQGGCDPSLSVTPQTNFGVIPPGGEEGLVGVEAHRADGALVLICVSFLEGLVLVVPDLEFSVVQPDKDPGTFGVKAQGFDTSGV